MYNHCLLNNIFMCYWEICDIMKQLNFSWKSYIENWCGLLLTVHNPVTFRQGSLYFELFLFYFCEQKRKAAHTK